MARLNYHRRHGLNCEGRHTPDSLSGEYDERKRGWKRCKCLIYASGTLGGVARKKATKLAEWDAARAFMAPHEQANSWGLQSRPIAVAGVEYAAPVLVTAQPSKPAVLIADAIKAYIDDHISAGSADNTVKKNREVCGKLKRFADANGIRTVKEWENDQALVRALLASWSVSPLTLEKQHGLLKVFFEFCVENGWLEKNPARFKRRRNRESKTGTTTRRQRIPYTDAEMQLMYEACEQIGKTAIRSWPKKKNGRQVEAASTYREYHRKWTGQDLADFISISAYTGLRISDVATFHIERLSSNGECIVRTTKNGATISAWVPEWLQSRIRSRAKSVGPLIFGTHTTEDINVITDVWRRKLKGMWKMVGPWKVKPEHHRFRHTFARMLLQTHTPISLVADLLGDTEKVVRKFYSAWVPERQEKTTETLRAAFADAPRPDSPAKWKVQAINS